MPPSAQRTHYHAKRGSARQFPRRNSLLERDLTVASQLPTTVPATPSASQAAPIAASLPSQSLPGLIGVVVLLVFLVLGFVGWRMWVWSRHNGTKAVAFSEKSSRPIGLFDAVDERYSMKRSLSQSSASTIVVDYPAGLKAALTRERSPAECKIDVSHQPKVVHRAGKDNTTPGVLPHGITVTAAPPPLHIPPPTYATGSLPIVSPRTAASKEPQTTPTPSTKLPRLVIVDLSFTVSSYDELEIRKGEILRLLEEYEDEWCLVERIDPKNAKRGVVPRVCVVDKPNIVRLKKSRHIPPISTAAKIGRLAA